MRRNEELVLLNPVLPLHRTNSDGKVCLVILLSEQKMAAFPKSVTSQLETLGGNKFMQ